MTYNDVMTIIYLKGLYERRAEIAIEFCCDEMEDNYRSRYPHVGYVGNKCSFCGHPIRKEERPITNYTDFDPPCNYVGCNKQSTDHTTIRMRGFNVDIHGCREHSEKMIRMANNMGMY